MIFTAPALAWLFLLLPLLILFFRISRRRLKKAEAEFAESALYLRLRLRFQPARRRWQGWLLLGATALILLALLQPRWGYDWQDLTRRGIDLVAVVDTSRSMLADDIAPDRLTRARRILEDILRRARGDRIGLVAFAGSAFTVCPLTLDPGALQMFVSDLSVNTIPRGGSNLAAGIRGGIRAFGPDRGSHRAILLISDGENLEGDFRAAANEAAEQGIVIFTLGVGSPEGVPIKLQKDGQTSYLKDRQDNIVVTRLDESALQEIALLTGGAYHRATPSGRELDLIYNERIARMGDREVGETRRKVYRHRYQFPLAGALILLVAETWLGSSWGRARWPGRRRHSKTENTNEVAKS